MRVLYLVDGDIRGVNLYHIRCVQNVFRFNATMDEGAKEHQVWMKRFLSDEVNQHLFARLTRTGPGRVTVKMPITGLKPTVDEIEIVRSIITSK